MASGACHMSLGAILIPWLEQSLWLIALLFTLTISIAGWAMQMLFLSLGNFMEDGLHLNCAGHLKVNLTVATGKFCVHWTEHGLQNLKITVWLRDRL
jgi:hypothetical protein